MDPWKLIFPPNLFNNLAYISIILDFSMRP